MTKYELYWAEREQANLLENIMENDQIAAEIAAVNNKAYLEAQEQLYAWYGKYGDAIYFHDAGALYLNLFIASELNWREKGVEVSRPTSASSPKERGSR